MLEKDNDFTLLGTLSHIYKEPFGKIFKDFRPFNTDATYELKTS